MLYAFLQNASLFSHHSYHGQSAPSPQHPNELPLARVRMLPVAFYFCGPFTKLLCIVYEPRSGASAPMRPWPLDTDSQAVNHHVLLPFTIAHACYAHSCSHRLSTAAQHSFSSSTVCRHVTTWPHSWQTRICAAFAYIRPPTSVRTWVLSISAEPS